MNTASPLREPSILSRAEDVLLATLRHKWLILGAWVPITLVAVIVILTAPPAYRTSGKVLLTSNRVDVSTSAERATELQRTSQMSEGELASQVEILRSRDLLAEVLEQLSPSVDTGPPPEPSSVLDRALDAPRALLHSVYVRLHGLPPTEPTDPLYWKILEVLARLEVTILPKSNIIEVAFTDPNPEHARDFVNTLMAAYIERYAQMHQISEAEDFFTNQSQLLRSKLDASESELRAARERAGVLAGQQAEIHERLNEFSAELARARVARAEQEQRVRYLESLQKTSAGRNTAPPALVALEAKRAEMIGRYRADSERMKAMDEEIARLRAALAGYDGVAGVDATAGAGAPGSVLAACDSLEGLKGKEEALEREKAAYQSQAEFIDARNLDLNRLERQAKLDEEAYLSYVRTAEESRVSNALEQSKLLRLRIIDRAPLPLLPAGHQKSILLLWGVLGGLVAAIALGVARDMLDPRLKTARDVTDATGLEVLAMIPPRV
jgi:uncharacterized protein involved in exopolysaccharide biosynthesis